MTNIDLEALTWYKVVKTEYTVQAHTVSDTTNIYNFLEDSNQTAEPNSEDVVLKGARGEEWVSDIPRVIRTYTHEDGREISPNDFVPDRMITLRTKPNGDVKMAARIPCYIQDTIISGGGYELKINRDGVPHDLGDHIVCDMTEDGKPNLADVWVVNGAVFTDTYKEV